MAVDGYLNFDTKLDTSGFNGGLAQVNTTVTKSIEKVKISLRPLQRLPLLLSALMQLQISAKSALSLVLTLRRCRMLLMLLFRQ